MKKLLLSGVSALLLATGTAHADVETEWPDDFQNIWCIQHSRSTTTKVFLVECLTHPEIHNREDAAVLLIARTLYSGPGHRYCRLDAIEEVEPETETSSPVYVVHGMCQSDLPVWTHFKIRMVDEDNDNVLIIEPLPEG